MLQLQETLAFALALALALALTLLRPPMLVVPLEEEEEEEETGLLFLPLLLLLLLEVPLSSPFLALLSRVLQLFEVMPLLALPLLMFLISALF